MDRIGYYCKYAFLGVVCIPALGWASYQPVSGSTVTIYATVGGNLQTQVNASTISVVNQSGQSLNVSVNTSTIGVVGTLSENGVSNATNRLGTLPAIYEGVNANADGTSSRNAALRVGANDGALRTTQEFDITRYSFTGSTNNWSVASSPTDITALCGNASDTVLVYGLRVSCTQTTAGIVQGSVIKYSTKFSGAWSTMTVVPQDSNYGVTNSTAVWFTANPTRGTELGHVDDINFGSMAPATASPNDGYWSPAAWRTKPIVLRGAAQCLAFNLEAVTMTGGKCSASWEWAEDTTY